MYIVSFEVAGINAMFSDPASGSTPVSYPAPTWSSLKGMFEAVARIKQAHILPTHVEICRPIRFERFTTNYGGPLRKSTQITGNNNLQLVATILVDVCYRVYGVCEATGVDGDGANYAHELQDIFTRRLKNGRLFYTPSLGWKEFIPTYFGPLREETSADETVNATMPSMLKSAFDKPTSGRFGPIFFNNVQIEKGVLYFGGKPGGDHVR